MKRFRQIAEQNYSVRFRGRANGSNYVPPVPPEPTPFDRVIPELDGLDNYETTFDTVVIGGIIIGLVGKNNIAAAIDMTITVDDVEILTIVKGNNDSTDSTFTYFGAVEDLPIGTHTIKITCNNGYSAGSAALRIIETDPLPDNWLGSSSTYSVSSGFTASAVAIQILDAEPNNLILAMSVVPSATCYPPNCTLYSQPYIDQEKVRDDLVGEVTAGFFRSNTGIGGVRALRFSWPTPGRGYSACMVELRGVVLRP